MTEPYPHVRDLTPEELVRRGPELLRLQRAAYAVEARVIGDDRIPPLRESLDELLAAGLTWRVALDGPDGRVVGALAHSCRDGVVDVDRLVVDPARHRHGVGRLLLTSLPEDLPAEASTGRANVPARRLYEAAGYRHVGDREVLPGLWVSDHARPARTEPAAGPSSPGPPGGRSSSPGGRR